MNNNYYNYYNPNSLFRAAPAPNFSNMMGSATRAGMMPARGAVPLPRISSLFSGASMPRVGAVAANAASGASKLSFSTLLNGASKTLGVINQAIPVFYQVKPIWNNAKTMFRVAREISSSNSSSTNSSSNSNNASNNTANTNTETNINSQEKESDNSPTFFI